jgi:hypothetical protein
MMFKGWHFFRADDKLMELAKHRIDPYLSFWVKAIIWLNFIIIFCFKPIMMDKGGQIILSGELKEL